MYSILLLLFLTSVNSLLQAPDYQLSYRTGHLTPRGYDHPSVSVSGFLSYETEGIPPTQYAGTILMMPFRPNWDIDVCRYLEYGALCVVVAGTTTTVPGFIMVKGYNDCYYDCAFDMNYPDFTELALLLGNVSTASGGTESIYVTLDSSDGNDWKTMSDSGAFYALQILIGITSILVSVSGLVDITIIAAHYRFELRNNLIIACYLVMAGLLGVPGAVDFTCFRQLMPHRACNVLTSSRISFIFGACCLLIIVMIEVSRVSVGISYGRFENLPLYLTFTIFLVVMDNLCATLLTYMETAESTITLIIIWLATILTITLLIATMLSIVSYKTLRRLRESVAIAPESRKGKLRSISRRLMIVLCAISVCLFGYVLNAGLVYHTIEYPDKLVTSFLVYTNLLNIIAIALAYNNHVSIRNHVKKLMKSSKSGGTDSSKNRESSTHTELTVTQNPN